MRKGASAAMKDYGGLDDQSVDFSVDPEMYTKLDIRKAKLGDDNAFDTQKIYQFQLEKDIKKLIAKKGYYQDRNKRFLEIRQMDEEYKRIAVPSAIATHGNFIEIQQYTGEESWKATTRPYGEQAHKRYLDYLANIPKGPSAEEVRDKQQRAMDKELWENIITGKTEVTKKDIKQKELEIIQRIEQQLRDDDELEHVRKRRLFREAVASGDFDHLRKLPTETEFINSLKNWSKGVHYPYDWEEGTPYVTVETTEGMCIVRERNKDETMRPDTKYSAEKFIGGANDGADQEYLEHMVHVNLQQVDKYLKRRRKEMVREQQLAEELRLIREKQRRRAARVERHDLASKIIDAKFNILQKTHQKVKKIKAKPGLLDPEEGEEGNGAAQQEEAEYEWSDSDSDGGGDGGNGGGDNGEEGKETDKEDADIGAVYQREHKTINAEDIARLNETLSPSKKKNNRKAGAESPDNSPTSANKRKLTKRGGSPETTEGNVSPARRGMSIIPTFTFDAAGNPVAASAMERDSQPPVKGAESAGADKGDPDPQNGKISDTEDVLEGRPDPLANNAKFGNKASMKYSSKYVHWEPGSVFANIAVPDFMRLRSSKQNSARVAPVGAAYMVKNYKQRHVAVKFVIRYLKKVHPKRLLFISIRTWRWWKKYYKEHFTNPENITRSEREKNAVLRKLDRLTADAASGEYHKSVVALAAEEIPSEEFLPYAKRKRRMFQKELAKFENRRCDPEDIRALSKLKKRAALHDEIYEARLAREKQAKQRAGLIQRYISDSRAQVEATSNFSFLDRQRIRWRNMKQDMVQRTVQLKNAGKQQEHILPEFDKHENHKLIQAMYDARQEDRKKSAWKRKINRRWKYILSGDENMLEDEDDKVRDVVDLILAARSGNYIEVMDIVMHPTHPVSPNLMNEDGITATYATLLMILRRELLDSEADLAMLGLSKWERFLKLITRKKENEPKLDLVLRVLLFKGGNVDFRFLEPSVDGVAMMHNAAEAGACDMIDWLLKKGTDMNIRTSLQQKTPLMVALEFNQLEVVNLLLRRGVMLHLDLVDAKGWTALHYAAVYARPELAVILLTCGAKPNVRNHAGRLPSEEARSRGRVEMATCIMTYKSDVVVVRARLDNLMNRTDNHYRNHKVKRTIHRHDTANAGGHATSASEADREDNEGGTAGGGVLQSAVGESTAAHVQQQQAAPNTVLLPPLQRRPQFQPSGSTIAEVGGSDAGGGTGTGFDAPDAPPGNAPAQRPLGGILDLDKKTRQERSEREVYERRMSSLVAQADPWNLAPLTKPRPLGMAKMSFYQKKPTAMSVKSP